MIVTHQKLVKDKLDYKDLIRTNLKFCIPTEISESDTEIAFNRIMQQIEKKQY